MLQCHFLELVLSKHFVVYESVRTTHLVFHSQLRAIHRISFNELQVVPNPYWFVVGVIVVDTLGVRAMVRYLLEYYASRWKAK
ncbi:hypothetical protein [Vibrio splendidus]|uniref:hypothetical protein n=1 Tax=Vibrio splendidus TaxID=29497 RepID=UPI001F52F682|nr:hypothetical protein [Vibrio splendidus]